ncbi:MAG TPA: GMC family oxidoreductase N-terminal domain-containing protein [Roseiarcus sp.]|nr:GMC family oxidoreductase N-terminal domain-containing protein [Roseiarcus sp.]
MGDVFDFVIVGAGSAGCVLAERLSASGRHSVAVIEAGGSDRRFWVQTPLGYGKTFYDPSLNWAYRAEPDPGLAGRSDYWPRGKLLGGSSSINAMVWVRGAAGDFDDWAAEGNPGWSYADCLPFFKSIEDNEAGEDLWRGRGGAQRVSDVSGRLHPLARRFIEAGRQAGFAFNPDFNGAAQDGVGVYQINTKNGWRMSAAKAFLRPAAKRRNVSVLSEAMATRLLFEGRRASGVEIRRGAQTRIIGARREVIVAAGAVNSPQLLQISGVGPGAHLSGLGVGVLHDSPAIGRHLQDHIGINYTYRSRVRTLNQALRPWRGKLAAGLDFLIRSRGPLSLSLNQAGGFVRTRPELPRADIQLYFQAISTLGAKSGTRPLLTPDPFPGFSLGLSNCRPTSRGSILARSADPFTAPRIEPNALATSEDVETCLEGVKLLRRLAAQPALAEVIEDELAPGPDAQSDAELIADFRRRAGTVYHPVGTCRMGPNGTSGAVDARLRVFGLEGLRVADASVFPTIVSGNVNAAVMMVAAKAASLILQDAR